MNAYERIELYCVFCCLIETQHRAIDFFAKSAYNIYMIQTSPRLSMMRTMAGSLFLRYIYGRILSEMEQLLAEFEPDISLSGLGFPQNWQTILHL